LLGVTLGDKASERVIWKGKLSTAGNFTSLKAILEWPSSTALPPPLPIAWFP